MELTDVLLEKFKNDGYCVLEDFISQSDIEAMKSECFKLVEEMSPADHHTRFSTETQNYRDDYFINSSDKIGYFFEDDALDKDGKLVVDKQKSLNKIGHALHTLCPAFKSTTFSEKMKNVVKKIGYDDPVVLQSMYIFKQPRIGGTVVPHQDGTFLYAEPLNVMGVWIALEDTTVDNGCLWFIPGSHKDGLLGNRRMVLSKAGEATATVFTGEHVESPADKFVAVPIKAGSVLFIDGCVVHKSERNLSEKSRHIYTFHLYEGTGPWAEENWIQPTAANTFVHMFANEK